MTFDLYAQAAAHHYREDCPAPAFHDRLGYVRCADCAAKGLGHAPLLPTGHDSLRGEVETYAALGWPPPTCASCGVVYVDSAPRGSDTLPEFPLPSPIQERAASRWAAGWRGPWGSL